MGDCHEPEVQKSDGCISELHIGFFVRDGGICASPYSAGDQFATGKFAAPRQRHTGATGARNVVRRLRVRANGRRNTA